MSDSTTGQPRIFAGAPLTAGSAPQPQEALQISNGFAAPLDAVPCLSFSAFALWLNNSIRERSRVAAFFVVPEKKSGQGGTSARKGKNSEPVQRTEDGAAGQQKTDDKATRRAADDGGTPLTADREAVRQATDGEATRLTTNDETAKQAADGEAVKQTTGGGAAQQTKDGEAARRTTGSGATLRETESESAQKAQPGKDAEPESFRLYAVLADYTANRLRIACTRVGRSYPSLTSRMPQLHIFEREIYEKYGIYPEGHPWLKPVRFSGVGGPEIGNMPFFRVNGDEVHEVAVGPIHAGVIESGHFRFQCLGELVMHLEISLGYHHRGLETRLTGVPGPATLALMETVAGDSSIAHSWAYCSVVEALADINPSPRGQLVRSLALELERLANHTGDLGALAGDTGFLSTMSYCGRLRGDWLNMTAMLGGNRFGRGLLCLGGVRFDLGGTLLKSFCRKLDETKRDVLAAVKLMWDSPSVMSRMTGIGVLSRDDAYDLGTVGVVARASGLVRDTRHSHPLPMLPNPPDAKYSRYGDVRARASVRYKEIEQSASHCKRLAKSFLDDAEEGSDIDFSEQKLELVPNSLAVALVEGWRGEVCHVALTDDEGGIAAYSVVDPSFHNWMGLALALRGQQISDFPLCNKSFNLSYCGHDL